jgi:hypothetical protein
MKTKIRIGLFGYGCVGSGIYDIISQLPSFEASIQKIAIKDKTKKRNLPDHLFTFNKFDILHNSEINVVVELIDDADEAFEIVIYLRYSNNTIFETLTFSKIEAEFISPNYRYTIGSVSLQQLINLNPNQRNDIFIAQVDSEFYPKNLG